MGGNTSKDKYNYAVGMKIVKQISKNYKGTDAPTKTGAPMPSNQQLNKANKNMKYFITVAILFFCSGCFHKSNSFMVGNWVINKLIINSIDYKPKLMSNIITIRNDGSFECSASSSNSDTITSGTYFLSTPDSIIDLQIQNKLFAGHFHIAIEKYDELGYVSDITLSSEKKYIQLEKLPPRSL